MAQWDFLFNDYDKAQLYYSTKGLRGLSAHMGISIPDSECYKLFYRAGKKLTCSEEMHFHIRSIASKERMARPDVRAKVHKKRQHKSYPINGWCYPELTNELYDKANSYYQDHLSNGLAAFLGWPKSDDNAYAWFKSRGRRLVVLSRERHRELMGAAVKSGITQERRQLLKAISIRSGQNPAIRKIRSETQKKLWADPEHRKRMKELMSNTQSRLWSDPEYRERMSKIISDNQKRLWQDPEYRERMSKILLDNVKKRLSKNPAYKSAKPRARRKKLPE